MIEEVELVFIVDDTEEIKIPIPMRASDFFMIEEAYNLSKRKVVVKDIKCNNNILKQEIKRILKQEKNPWCKIPCIQNIVEKYKGGKVDE